MPEKRRRADSGSHGGGSGGVEKVQGKDEVRYLARLEPVIHGSCSKYRRSIDGRFGRSKRPLWP